jgi:hypothetical protein
VFPLFLSLALAVVPGPNVLCPVTGQPVVNHDLYHHVAVWNHTYYVRDAEAARKLKAFPMQYLKPDGTPRNAPEPAR